MDAVRGLHKRARATSWTIKLPKALEGELKRADRREELGHSTLAKKDLRRRERMRPGSSSRDILEDELRDIASRELCDGSVKNILSSVRLLEKLGWL